MNNNNLTNKTQNSKEPNNTDRFPEKIPPRVLILLSVQRSGSTWLFDALRSHPAINIQKSAEIFSRLCKTGRRYPGDLSGIGKDLFEVTTGTWEKIPDFKVKEGNNLVPPEILRNQYTIEKWHPFFFKHDFQTFLQNISELEKKAMVKFIYLIRDPKNAIISFLNYQKRNSSWNEHISHKKLPQHMKYMYDSLLRMAIERKGIIVEYEDMINDFHANAKKIFSFLWQDYEDAKNENIDKLIDLISKITARDKRKPESTTFFGKKPTSDYDDDPEYKDFFSIYSDEVYRCYLPYRLLSKFKPSGRPIEIGGKNSDSMQTDLLNEFPELIKEVTQQNLEMVEAKEEIVMHYKTIVEKNDIITKTNSRLKLRDAQIHEIRNSWVWKASLPFRYFRRKYLKKVK